MCSAKLQVRATTQQRRPARQAVVAAAADNRAAAGFAAAALAAAVLVSAPVAKADLVRRRCRWAAWHAQSVFLLSTVQRGTSRLLQPLPGKDSLRRSCFFAGWQGVLWPTARHRTRPWCRSTTCWPRAQRTPP